VRTRGPGSCPLRDRLLRLTPLRLRPLRLTRLADTML
jgi:hypothetical protein